MAAVISHDAFRLVAVALAFSSVIGGVALIWYSVRSDGTDAVIAVAPRASALPVTLRFSTGTFAVLERLPGGHLVEIVRSPCRIGRHSTDDVVVDDVRVSRHHARLERKADGGIEIHNETAGRSEPNPLLVNGEYRETALLADGDMISLGGVELRVHIVGADRGAAT